MLGYWDTFAGMVPCRIERIYCPLHEAWRGAVGDIVITANRGPYRKGDKLTRPMTRIVPRSAVRFRKYGTTIRAWSWREFLAA